MPQPSRKYQPLADYLAAHTGDEVTLTFADIERIIDAPLPASAGTRKFWSNTESASNHASHTWQGVGWRTVVFDPRQRWVMFRRGTTGTPPAPAIHHTRERPPAGGWFWPGRTRSG